MIQQLVTDDCLTVVLNEQRFPEELPEPFRLRPNVLFLVSYSAYTAYLLSLPKSSKIKLSGDRTQLVELANIRSFTLYPFYLKDIAFAIAKEAWFAERFSGKGSLIFPFSESGSSYSAKQALLDFDRNHLDFQILFDLLGHAGFDNITFYSSHNIRLLKIAAVLYYRACHEVITKELTLVYDLS